MKLTLLSSESKGGQRPTLYGTDRATYVIQGWKVLDEEALAAMNIPAHETAVEVPSELMRFLPGAQG